MSVYTCGEWSSEIWDLGIVSKEPFMCHGDGHCQPLFFKWDNTLIFSEWGVRCSSHGFFLFLSYLIPLLWPLLCSRWLWWNPSSITMHSTLYTPLSMVRIVATACPCKSWILHFLWDSWFIHSFIQKGEPLFCGGWGISDAWSLPSWNSHVFGKADM